MKNIWKVLAGFAMLIFVAVCLGQTYYEIIQFRRGTASQWTTADPVLSQGEPGFETDSTMMKIGDGLTHWNSLAYSIVPHPWADVREYGAKVDGVTDDKTALTAAVASGKTVCIPNGTLGTTTTHIMNIADGQKFGGSGMDNTILKRLSGTNTVLHLTGKNYQTVNDITIDGNNLDGIGLRVAGTGQQIDKVRIKQVGGTAYALSLTGNTFSALRNISIPDGSYNQINCNYVLDSNFFNINCGTPGNLYGLNINNGSEAVSFYSLYTEGRILVDGIGGGNVNINFYRLSAEVYDPVLATGSWFTSNTTGNMGINIYGGKITAIASSTAPFFNIIAFGFKLDGMFFRRTDSSGAPVFSLGTLCSNTEISNFIDYNNATHTFIQDVVDSSFTTLRNCWTHTSGQAGTCVWSGGNIVVENSNLKQTFTASARNISMTNVTGTITITNLAATSNAVFRSCADMVDSSGNAFVAAASGVWIKATTGDLAQVMNGQILQNTFDNTLKIGKAGVWVTI